MPVDILIGLQWGDEGKGKIIDLLSPNYNIIARFQGGPNAGHTLLINDKKYIFHTLPSGVIHEHTLNVLGSGMVIDPTVLKKEALLINDEGINPYKSVVISSNSHLIIPSHKYIDAYKEEQKGDAKIGSTLKGIGPCYEDKTGRVGLRTGNILQSDFIKRYNDLKKLHFEFLDDERKILADAEEEIWFEAIDYMRNFKITETEILLNDEINKNTKILVEGAQGTLLDLNFGTYPYVTSSTTIAAGACTSLGISPKKINDIYGVYKAYTTRVGEGPLLTEQKNEIGELLTQKGFEFGSTTGRKRRCGWLDLVALKYACMLNGVTKLIITKPDVLSGFKQVSICTDYLDTNDNSINYAELKRNSDVKPIYEKLEGWEEDLSEIRTFDNLPANFKNYLSFIESELQCPTNIISVGPERNQTIFK